MNILTRLLDFLPTYFNTDPLIQLGISLSHSDPAARMTFSVKNNVISACRFGVFVNDFEISLAGKTLSEVATEINAVSNYTATTPDIMAAERALCLVDTENQVDGLAHAFTNPMWAFFKALAMELKEAKDAELEMLRHMSVPGATGIGLNYWGEYFDNTRIPGETDVVFGQRVIDEIKRPKSNNVAMEIILQAYYGFKIDVVDLDYESASVMLMNNTPTPVHNTSYPIFDSTSLAFIPAVFGLIFPDDRADTWTAAQLQELRELVYQIKATGMQPLLAWINDSNVMVSQYL